MKTLIVYCSKYGTTGECAKEMAEHIKGPVSLSNLQSGEYPGLKEYDTVLIGGSIYGGNIQKQIQAFTTAHQEELLRKNVGLFISCAFQDKSEAYFTDFFPDEIYEHAFAKVYVGYGYNFEKMGLVSKMLVKALAKVKESRLDIEKENIRQLGEMVNRLHGENG